MQNTLILNPSVSIKHLSFKLNSKVFWILSSVLVVSFLALYIFQINTVIRNSYLIKNYEQTLSTLSQENNILKINLSRSNSLDDIEKRVINLDFEKISEVKYIQILGSEVATK